MVTATSLHYAFTVAVLATLPVVAVAQEPVVKGSLAQLLTIGSQVRIRSSAVMGHPRGRVVALDDEVVSLLLDDEGGVLKIPVPSVTALELNLGKQRHPRLGLGIGGGIGVLVGLSEKVGPFETFHSRSDAVLVNTIWYGALGTLAGALVRTDRWAAVNISAVMPRARPGHAGLGLAAMARF